MSETVFAFAVRCPAFFADFERIVNARNRGAAIYEYMLDVRDCWPDVKFTDFRARKLGPAQTSEAFRRTATYRGMPNVRCGQRVMVDGAAGVIVGHNDSANFDVLFDDDSYFKGARLNVHPSEITLQESADGGVEP